MKPINQLWKHSEGVWSHHFLAFWVVGTWKQMEVAVLDIAVSLLSYLFLGLDVGMCLNSTNNYFNATNESSVHYC